MKKYSFLCIILLGAMTYGQAQAIAYTDAAQAFNKLLIEKNNGTYTQISNYKVKGTPYLMGEKQKGNLFAIGETAFNIYLSYNTFNQEVEFYSSANPDKPLVKELNDVDSFLIKADRNLIREDMLFVNGSIINAKEKSFFQVVARGPRFSLYKKYKSELGMVSTNYVQSELRQFDLSYEYFYTDTKTNELKKLKLSNKAIIKEFKDVKDLSELLNDGQVSSKPDFYLIPIFALLNS